MSSLPSSLLRAAVTVATIIALVPGAASAQLRAWSARGAGIAGSTESTLSEGRTAPSSWVSWRRWRRQSASASKWMAGVTTH